MVPSLVCVGSFSTVELPQWKDYCSTTEVMQHGFDNIMEAEGKESFKASFRNSKDLS